MATASSTTFTSTSLTGTGSNAWTSDSWASTGANQTSEILLIKGFGLTLIDPGGGLTKDDYTATATINLSVVSGFGGTPVVDSFAKFYWNGSAFGADLKTSVDWPLFPDGFDNRSYQYAVTANIPASKIEDASFGFGIQVFSVDDGQNAQCDFNSITIDYEVARTFETLISPLFSPTGNSNWAKVRMNPLLRM